MKSTLSFGAIPDKRQAATMSRPASGVLSECEIQRVWRGEVQESSRAKMVMDEELWFMDVYGRIIVNGVETKPT